MEETNKKVKELYNNIENQESIGFYTVKEKDAENFSKLKKDLMLLIDKTQQTLEENDFYLLQIANTTDLFIGKVVKINDKLFLTFNEKTQEKELTEENTINQSAQKIKTIGKAMNVLDMNKMKKIE